MKQFIRIPRLSRRARIVRNFLLALLLLAAVVLALGVPPLTKYGVFRRLEKEYLLTPSQLVYQIDRGGAAAYLSQGESWITAGMVRTLDSGGTPLFHYKGYLNYVLPRDEMQVLILPLDTEDGSTVVALWGAPEGAATGELELTLEGLELPFGYEEWTGYTVPERETFSAQGVRREDGWFFFTLNAHPEETMCAMDALWGSLDFWQVTDPRPYRLTLWDGQGNTVWTGSGETAEGYSIGLTD